MAIGTGDNIRPPERCLQSGVGGGSTARRRDARRERGLELQLGAVAREWSASIVAAADWPPEQAGAWGMRLVALTHRVTTAAFRVVDRAIDVTGEFGVSRGGEIERLFRDVRMGSIRPANFAVAHELVAKALLGIDLDDPQRFG